MEEITPVFQYKATTPANEIKMEDRYKACMVLAGVGDALVIIKKYFYTFKHYNSIKKNEFFLMQIPGLQ